MREQIGVVLRLFVGDEWIINDIGQDVVQVLTDYIQESRVLGILHPLGPAIGQSRGHSQGHTA